MLAEISPATERVTAVLTSHMATGENFDGAVLIGVYPESKEEVWIEHGGHRWNPQIEDIAAFCKQLKRAGQIAKEQADGE